MSKTTTIQTSLLGKRVSAAEYLTHCWPWAFQVEPAVTDPAKVEPKEGFIYQRNSAGYVYQTPETEATAEVVAVYEHDGDVKLGVVTPTGKSGTVYLNHVSVDPTPAAPAQTTYPLCGECWLPVMTEEQFNSLSGERARRTGLADTRVYPPHCTCAFQ